MKTKKRFDVVLFSRVSDQDLTNFTKHMSVMLKSGINIFEVVDTLADQTKSQKLKNILLIAKKDIKDGLSLSKSLLKFPKVFDLFYISIIRIGEETGTLDKSLEYLSTKLQKDSELKKRVAESLFYPRIVIVMSIVIALGISIFVLPKMGDMFTSFNVELPLATRIMLGFSDFMTKYNIMVVVLLIGIYLLFKVIINSKLIKPIWTNIVFATPGIGPLLISTETASLCRNLGVMLSSGLSLSRALEILADTTENCIFRGYVQKLQKSVGEGRMIGEELSLGKFAKMPDMVVKMLSVGEKSGGLNEMLLYLGDNYDSESNGLAKNLSSLVEPLLLFFIACIVMLIALAVVLPIYQLTGSING